MANANALRISIRGRGHNPAGLASAMEGMVIDLSPINSASSDSELDFLDESGDSQFAELLEKTSLRLKAGQGRP